MAGYSLVYVFLSSAGILPTKHKQVPTNAWVNMKSHAQYKLTFKANLMTERKKQLPTSYLSSSLLRRLPALSALSWFSVGRADVPPVQRSAVNARKKGPQWVLVSLWFNCRGFFWKLSLNVVSNKTKTIKMIGHHSRFRDVMGQSYSIYAWTRANYAHRSTLHFAVPQNILLKVILWKKLDR